MPTPFVSITANGKPTSSDFNLALISVTVTDGEGEKSDTLQIELDDIDGSIIAPETGATLQVTGGYLDDGRTRDFGLFKVDGVSFSGYPQKISISAQSVGAKSLAKQREPKAYPKEEFPTYGDIFKELASKVGLMLEMASELMGIANPYEAQSEEDALEFATRVGEKLDASVTVKSERLVVVAKGEGKSASGAALPEIAVAPGLNLLTYQVNEKDDAAHSDVEATYYDREKNKRETVNESTSMDGPKYLLRAPYQNQDEAKRAAKAKAKELKRAKADVTFDIDGEPFAQAGAMAVASGIRERVDGRWPVKTVVHKWDAGSAYTTSLQCEAPS